MPINKSESTKRVKLNLKGLTQAEKSKAKRESGIAIVDDINKFLDRNSSPVEGGRFKQQKADGSKSSLFEFGDMRSQITFDEQDTDHVDVGVFADAPTKEILKSFNHNTGDTLPKREFIAAPNKRFKKSTMNKVSKIISKIKRDADSAKQEEDDLVRTILSEDDLLDLL